LFVFWEIDVNDESRFALFGRNDFSILHFSNGFSNKIHFGKLDLLDCLQHIGNNYVFDPGITGDYFSLFHLFVRFRFWFLQLEKDAERPIP
jgi:hypothetical protein